MKKGATTMNMRNSGVLSMASPAYTTPVGTMSYGGSQPTPVAHAHAHAHAHAVATTQPTATTQSVVASQPTFAAPVSYGSMAAPTSYAPSSYAPTQVTSPIVHPTQHSVNRNVFRHVVPHIHPSHTHTVNEHQYQHQHYFTHTCSTSNKCCSQHVVCGHIPPPCPPRPCGWR